jgi:hypothetical protein
MTAALCRKRASESLTDVKEMENRKQWRHKKWHDKKIIIGVTKKR